MRSLKVLSSQNPREIAADVLTHRPPAEYIEDILERALASETLNSKDRGLCQELVYGVVRNESALDWLIARKTPGRNQKPALRTLLRLGLYQIFWTDRIPGHAAVNETVELAKRRGFGPQAGFVNAVLRGYLRERDATKGALDVLKSAEPWTAFSHPEWLVRRWTERWGAEQTLRLLEWNNTPPEVFARVNTLKTDAGKLLEQWRQEDVEYDFARTDWLDENLVFRLKRHPALHRLPSFQQGFFYVQDPSTLLAVRHLDARPGHSVLDMCAAPGGKFTAIAQQLQGQGQLVGRELSHQRLNILSENCTRLGIQNAELELAADAKTGSFDRILIDAPCSNTGVMRRRVELRWRIRPEEIERLCSGQLELLAAGAAMVKPGGILVYSTCSLEPEENGSVVARFLSTHPEFRLDHERTLLPFIDGTDGAFVARLIRTP